MNQSDELTLTEQEIQAMKLDITPQIKKRGNNAYYVNEQLANALSATLNKIKGRLDSEIAQSGKLDIERFISFRINKKSGAIPSFDIFNQITESRGLDLYFLIDCSWSMRFDAPMIRDITATVYKALEKCPFINFHALAYSGKHYQFQTVIDIIENLDDCKRIEADENDILTPTNLAIDYAVEKLSKSENKKMIIIFTDGIPEAYIESVYVSEESMRSFVKRSIVKARNKKIPLFAIYYNRNMVDPSSRTLTRQIFMRDMFGSMMYETNDFSDVQTMLTKQMIKAVEALNK